jgi:hypothetical protein
LKDSVGLPNVLLESRRFIGVLHGGVVTGGEESVIGEKVGRLLGVIQWVLGGAPKWRAMRLLRSAWRLLEGGCFCRAYYRSLRKYAQTCGHQWPNDNHKL